MKNFSLKTRENYPLNSKSKRIQYILLGIGVLFLLLVGTREILGGFSSILTTPLYVARHYLETSSATVPIFLRSRIELMNEINELKQEVSSWQGSDVTFTQVFEENKELRLLLNASSSPRSISGVLSRPPYSPYDTLVIDKGSEDGIVQNAPVYYGKGRALGYVRTVYPHSSLVTLFSSPGVETTVYVYGPNIFTTAYGEGGGVIHLSIPQGITIREGDVVILPSLDTGALGVVNTIQSIPAEPEQHAYLTFDVPIQSIRLVSVGSTPVSPVSFEDALGTVEEGKKLFTFPIPQDFQMDGSGTSSTMSQDTTTENNPEEQL